MLADNAWSRSKNNLHKLIRGFANYPKWTEVAPPHIMLYINFRKKCTIIYLLTIVGVSHDFFSLSSSFDFHFLLNMLWNWRQGLFSHSRNTTWQIEMLGVFPPSSRRHHVSLVLRLFSSLRIWISNLQMKSFSSFFWHSWYSALTKVCFKLDSRSWEAGELWNVNKCQGLR